MGGVYATCIEHVPQGGTRPRLAERFPVRGLAGYALPLEIIVEHGAGETVLPHGFSLQTRGTEAEGLARAGFTLPEVDGGSPPALTVEAPGRTRVVLPLLALPKEGGRHELYLPPIPLAVARASGELITVCTSVHRIVIEDPTANTPDAKPRPNPPPRRQREDWVALRSALETLGLATVGAVGIAMLLSWWYRRPRPVPPPPPPRPAWETALAALDELRRSRLIEDGKLVEHVDRVSDIVRNYLGDRYGFDGLEATSPEVRREVRRIVPPPPVLPEIDRLLDEADLVKFARALPAPDDCRALLALAETIVRSTIPASLAPGELGAGGPA